MSARSLKDTSATLMSLSKMVSLPLFVLGAILITAKIFGVVSMGWFFVIAPWLVAMGLPSAAGVLGAVYMSKTGDYGAR